MNELNIKSKAFIFPNKQPLSIQDLKKKKCYENSVAWSSNHIVKKKLKLQ